MLEKIDEATSSRYLCMIARQPDARSDLCRSADCGGAIPFNPLF